jgi:ribosomal protein L37AE/L43A
MYERFTDRARKVIQLANQEAKRINHEYIGTEHILLGLVKEGSGVAANVLKQLDIDLHKIHLEVEKIIPSGPDRETVRKLPMTPRAKKVIEYSREEARKLNHNYVGTEHILLGLIHEGEGVAAQVLMNLGLKLEDVREAVLNLLGQNPTRPKCPSCGKPMLKRVSKSGPFLGCSGYPECRTTMQFGSARTNVPLSSTSESVRSLEQQLWNVRVLLGALCGVLAGALLAASIGAVLGLILGGTVAALGRRIPAVLAGGATGILLGAEHLPNEGGSLAGVLLGALTGLLIAEVGSPFDPRRFFGLLRRK